jgi:hypothetical protein
VLLLFAWPAVSQQAQEGSPKERDQARALLPFLTDLVDTILLHLLTAPWEGESLEEPTGCATSFNSSILFIHICCVQPNIRAADVLLMSSKKRTGNFDGRR